ncbi:MAG: PTS sugar transporter subunit IIA [bacterium]|nr:PTS sugar transporter subunit IIA [bacterium]
MLLSEYIRAESVYLGLQATESPAVLEELVTQLARALPIEDPALLTAALIEREGLSTTGIGKGIAVPHCKSAQVEELVILLGRSAQGVEFKSLDGQPVRLFFLLVAPMSAASTHLKALAKIARMAKQEEVIQRFLSLETAPEVFAYLQELDQQMD